MWGDRGPGPTADQRQGGGLRDRAGRRRFSPAFVGGECAESTVRAQSLEVLATGETRLLRSPRPDRRTVRRTDRRRRDHGAQPPACPVARWRSCSSRRYRRRWSPSSATRRSRPALLRRSPLRPAVRAVTSPGGTSCRFGTTAVVVASHGSDEEPILSASLQAGIPYVGLVASRKRGPAVVAFLRTTLSVRRSTPPAGLDIGARSAPEVALSILAEIVATRHERGTAGPGAVGVGVALDDARNSSVQEPGPGPGSDPRPGSGMRSLPPTRRCTPTLRGRVHFCGTGCRSA